MITRLHRAQVTIRPGGETTARAFYCALLGLPEIARPAALADRGGFWVRLGDQRLHIGVEHGVARAATKAHLAYEIADLVAWRIRLAGADVIAIESVPIPGYGRIECRDPFGNRLEIIQPLAPIDEGITAPRRD